MRFLPAVFCGAVAFACTGTALQIAGVRPLLAGCLGGVGLVLAHYSGVFRFDEERERDSA